MVGVCRSLVDRFRGEHRVSSGERVKERLRRIKFNQIQCRLRYVVGFYMGQGCVEL